MPYIARDADGRIRSLHRDSEADAIEFLPNDHADVQAFVGRSAERSADEMFSRLDADLVRVLEDLINVLVGRGVIDFTDLPPEAQAKLLARKSFRDRLNVHLVRSRSFIDVLDDTKFGQLR